MLCAYWPPRLSPYERPSWVLFPSRVKLGIVVSALFRSAPSRRGTFRPIFSGPSGSHPREHKLRRCSYPALPPSAFHFPATKILEGRGGDKHKSNSVSRREFGLHARRVVSLSAQWAGTASEACWEVGSLSAGPSPHSRTFSGRVPEHWPKP